MPAVWSTRRSSRGIDASAAAARSTRIAIHCMLTTPFLTDLDSRAAVKGSRDALGLLAQWTRLGRHVVGNLTMASSSLRDFTVTLLGHYFAEQLSDDLGAGSELDTFLKWEQLAGYARLHVNRDGNFRGVDRVRRLLNESSRVTISADRAHQILGNQKTYGLWALYTWPSRSSGLLDGEPARVTPPARDLIERHYLPQLAQHGGGKDAQRILGLLKRPQATIDLDGRERDIGKSIARALSGKLSSSERSFYLRNLVDGGYDDSTEGRQRQLADLIEESLGEDGFAWSPPRLAHFIKRAQKQGADWAPLASRLERIRCAETVFAPCALLFSYLLAMEGKTLKHVAERLKDEWGKGVTSVDRPGFEALRAELATDAPEVANRWIEIAAALKGGDYERLVTLLAQHNQAVMRDRGGVAWLEIANRKLVVRFRDEQGRLPAKAELPTLWRFPYFLGALRQISAACGGTQRPLRA